MKPDWDAKRWSCWDSMENEEKDAMVLTVKHMEGPISQTRNTVYAKREQRHSPSQWAAPSSETLLLKEYIPVELIVRPAKFPQKAREQIQAWQCKYQGRGD